MKGSVGGLLVGVLAGRVGGMVGEVHGLMTSYDEREGNGGVRGVVVWGFYGVCGGCEYDCVKEIYE